jgi:hypothetical protein
MPLLIKNAWLLLALAAVPCFASVPPTYHVLGDDPGPWPKILESAGFQPLRGGAAGVVVIRRGSDRSGSQWRERVEKGGMFLVLEGESAIAESLGFRPGPKRVNVQSIREERAPHLSVVWEKAVELPVWTVPKEAQIFASERWDSVPIVAGMKLGLGGILWVAVTPGQEGYERFPYLMQALGDLGLSPPFRSQKLWAFFDSSYRLRVDIEYFARRWRKSGIAALQVAAWHFHDETPENAAYLKRLIEACHREGILVYAWLELPHVSEGFWNAHPEWREKTALLQDAHLDWRKLMNLTNRAAFAEASRGVTALLSKHDWDGVNLAELYFESLEVAANAARFTPMNDDVRAEFQKLRGTDPLQTYATREFLEYRVDLARRQQLEWLGVIGAVQKKSKPWLDVVVTHIDDQFDTRMRDLLGADAKQLLAEVEHRDITFLIEDPATIWNLGPRRYPEIAARYRPLTRKPGKLAIDINIVERYQDVYPTKLQTGTELFQLIHLAAGAFERVALYFENSISREDEPWIGSAAAQVTKYEQNTDGSVTISSRDGVGVPVSGPVLVNGAAWPFREDDTVWLPGGTYKIQPAISPAAGPPRLLSCTARIASLTMPASGKALDFAYESPSRNYCRLAAVPASIEMDGVPAPKSMLDGLLLMLPKGQHIVTLHF